MIDLNIWETKAREIFKRSKPSKDYLLKVAQNHVAAMFIMCPAHNLCQKDICEVMQILHGQDPSYTMKALSSLVRLKALRKDGRGYEVNFE